MSLFVLLAVPLSLQSQPHPFTVHDLLSMDRISGQQVSPSGDKVVFVLRVTDLEADRGRTDLWMVNIDGSGLTQLTTDPENDSDPFWSSDGESIYFLSSRTGSKQVWQHILKSGEEKQITSLPLDVNYLLPSPDGQNLAIIMDVFPGMTFQETRIKVDEREKRKSSGVIYEDLFIRHWDTWEDGRRSHLFIFPLNGGAPVDLMPDMDADTPSQPFGGIEEIAFTSDGTGIVFTTKAVDEKEAWSTDWDLYYVPIDGSVEPECLTEKNEAWDTQPVFSPDGKILAYLAMDRPQYESDRYRIILRDWPDGPERVLTANWDRSPSHFFWSKDGKKIFAVAENLAQGILFSINVKTAEVTPLIDRGHLRSPSLAGKRIVYGLDNLKSPVELYSSDLKGENIKQITAINADKLAAVEMGDYEQFSFSGYNNETVYGYLVKPADFDPSRKYPVAFLIHGGPHGSFGNDFHYRWNPQTYAGAGYAVVMIDFHGSAGYGQEFQDIIRGNWALPMFDLQKGLAAALEKYPFLNGERVGALGASYGGYMINWIAGNWPDGFRCLVNHDGNIDERMAYFDTEELWFPEWEHLGTPWDNPDGYEKHNPLNYVKNWKTPMLVVHGQKDYRVVVTQGIGTFNALQRKGIPSQFLYFPDENHWVLKPNNSILWHDTVLAWLNRWLREEE
ncbi:MAG: S9 family peptidase [Calditrichaeota bacterium]|nr:MAG: S9 family peptidase [Calditrichota bacterium]